MRLRKFRVSAEEHKKRTELHLEKGRELKNSFDTMTDDDWENVRKIKAYVKYPHNILLASDPIFSNIKFGAIGTLQSSGCVVFVSAYIIDQFLNRRFDICEWTDMVVEKGYRFWCFEKYPKVSFSSKNVDLSEAKKKLSGIAPEIQNCDNLEKLYEVVGQVKGIGGSMYLIDNVIFELSGGNIYESMNVILHRTRLCSVSKIVENLISGFMVPIRVNNAIYHDDRTREGGHYVILIGIEDGEAYVLDSSIGFVKLPFRRLMKAMVANDGLIAAWDTSCIN